MAVNGSMLLPENMTPIPLGGVGGLASRNNRMRVIGAPYNINLNMAPPQPWHVTETWREYRATQVMESTPKIRDISGGGSSVILGHTAKICSKVLSVKKVKGNQQILKNTL